MKPTSSSTGRLSQLRGELRPDGGAGELTVTGPTGSGKALLLSLLLPSDPGTAGPAAQPEKGPLMRPVLIIAPGETEAATLADDLRALLALQSVDAPVTVLPPRPTAVAGGSLDNACQRVTALRQLLARATACIVTTPAAAQQAVVPRHRLRAALTRLAVGAPLERDSWLRQLVDLGYQPASRVDQPGQFAARGGVIDCFDPGSALPVRIELLGDQIESLRTFDPVAQTSLAHLTEVEIGPTRELLITREEGTRIARLWREHVSDAHAEEWPPPIDAEPWLAAAITDAESLLDYLPPSTLIVLDEPGQLDVAADDDDEAGGLSWAALLEQSRAFARLSLQSLGVDSMVGQADGDRRIDLSGTTLPSAGARPDGTGWAAMLQRVTASTPEHHVMILAHSHSQQQRLVELLRDEELPAARWTPRLFLEPEQTGALWVAVGELSHGCQLVEAGWLLITEEELFGKERATRPLTPSRRARLAAGFSSLEELKLDSYVVHVRHGIGRYQGLQRLTVGGFESDFLMLAYAGGDKIYVPLDRLDLVQKYIGMEGSHPRLDRLGSGTWARTTTRVKRAVEKLARDLLDLYAARSVAPGHAFASDESAARAFAASFEYEETADQLRAIDEVMRNMETPHPMDRLVCGDVGYGKTEVAMRAAFKTAMDGKQTALLAPTTLLAQQHARTFSRRFASFPVRVELLSRFRSGGELKALRRSLATGEIDILIGTHRLLQRDILFHDLGLLVIDEEQRFGVRQKEQLKTLKQSVDCLTLSATPIPRTLQMGLLNLRDLSTIETPPPDRRAVQTRLVPFDRELIRSAVRFELARGGQCFFVHNRIHDLERYGRLLAELVPEARIAMAHGQMRPALLEAAMGRFLCGEADLLLSTSIVESGLDIPRANTIIIHRADLFGLADLYQLRGRVGRSAIQAFAYLIVPDESTLTSAARARLEAIRDFTELGAGFKIAARDLEIRGAGNLLGPQQSGQIAAVGYELYLQFLDEAVRHLRGESVVPPVEPTLALRLAAYLPDDYVADSHQRLAFYKRLASAADDAEVERLCAQLVDQFGPLPGEARRLVDLMTLRLLAKRLGLHKIETTDTGVRLHFGEQCAAPADGVKRLLARARGRCRFVNEWTIALDGPTEPWPLLFESLRADLQSLLGCDTT